MSHRKTIRDDHEPNHRTTSSGTTLVKWHPHVIAFHLPPAVAAGERIADLLTLVSSALRNDLEVWAYVKDVLDRSLAGSTDYASPRPDRWAASRPEHTRVYRTVERRDRAAAKADRRTRRRAGKPISR